MSKTLIYNAQIVNEGRSFTGAVLIDGLYIAGIFEGEAPQIGQAEAIDAQGMWLLPGVIDDQVHFREPGLTYKADLYTESRAAVAGGTTSYMEMPNTSPQTTSQAALADKFRLAQEKSLANYSFYIGATNDNLTELLATDPSEVCGIKVFMGSSTGNMLVDKEEVLRQIFEKSRLLIATHCEDEATIRTNTLHYQAQYGEDMPVRYHADLRSDEACYLSSAFAVGLAREYNTRLHVLHLSSAREMELFDNSLPAAQKRITAEVCVHHLWFDSRDYDLHGNRIKWNPAVKHPADREALWQALLDDRLDVIATDHAPHTAEEKAKPYFKAPSGGPLVQHSLVAMLQFVEQGRLPIERVVDKMCHKPAEIFQVQKRGFLRVGYYADLVLVQRAPWKVSADSILYKCGWSPFEGAQLDWQVVSTYVNGHRAYHRGQLDDSRLGQALRFDR